MKNIFRDQDKNEILQRVEHLTPTTPALWGQMNVSQMLAHCVEGLKMPTGELKSKRAPFPFNIMGRLLKKMVLAEGELRKNSPTTPEIKMSDPKDFENEKVKLVASINKLHALGEDGIKPEIHPFFGKMTQKEWGRLNYKHLDHHLRQFGA